MRSSSSEEFMGCNTLQRHVRPTDLRYIACVSLFCIYSDTLISFRISKNFQFYDEQEAPLFYVIYFIRLLRFLLQKIIHHRPPLRMTACY